MRRHIPALSLLGSLILLPACATEQDVTGNDETRDQHATEPAESAESRRRIEVIRLEHAAADDVVGVLDDLVAEMRTGTGENDAQAISDPRTNSVIVLGDAAELTRMKTLVARLDVPSKTEK